MKPYRLDQGYTLDVLKRLLETPSPSGFTDNAVHLVCKELDAMGISYELTRRGAIRANIKGEQRNPDRAMVAHIDTLGAMVKGLKPNGRCELVPVGHWNARFAEGARVTLYSENTQYRGTIVPLKASGHTYADEVDKQPSNWQNLELRIDERVYSLHDLISLGVHVGDFVAIDPQPEFNPNGYINSRHLDDKAGAAALLGAMKAIRDLGVTPSVDCHFLFTISEELGCGASAVLHQDVAEMITIDNGTVAPGQNSSEFGVTIAMSDMTGPFDYHLTRHLIRLCQEFAIPFQRDIFRYYRSDSASAVDAGNDLRTALVTFGVDASHGWERSHWNALDSLGQLLLQYVTSPPVFLSDQYKLDSRENFPVLPSE